MVSHINIAVNDDLAERARAVKAEQNLTWEEFIEAAVEHMEAHSNGE